MTICGQYTLYLSFRKRPWFWLPISEVKLPVGFYVSIGFAYSLILLGAINIIYSMVLPGHYRRKAISPLIGSPGAITLNIFYNFTLIPIGQNGSHLTPLGFAISSAGSSLALFP